MCEPSLRWVKKELRGNLIKPLRKQVVLQAFVVGSVAKGSATPTSDLDIAVVVPNKRGKTSLQFTENYHASFKTDYFKPTFAGRVVDFQFFYPDDLVLSTYDRKEIF